MMMMPSTAVVGWLWPVAEHLHSCSLPSPFQQEGWENRKSKSKKASESRWTELKWKKQEKFKLYKWKHSLPPTSRLQATAILEQPSPTPPFSTMSFQLLSTMVWNISSPTFSQLTYPCLFLIPCSILCSGGWGVSVWEKVKAYILWKQCSAPIQPPACY